MLNKILILCLGLFSVLSWADKPLIKLSTLDWPPYIAEKLDPESGKKGYVYDIIQAVMKEAGYEVQILFFPWARTVSAAKAGETDGYFPEYFVAHDWCKLSDAFPGGPLGLYKRKDFRIAFSVDPRMNQEQALKDLKQYNFGVVRDYVNTEVFDKANYLKKEESVSDENNLRKLSNRRIDFVVID
ncbi:MAG: substrate-binding periplasmic protein, partial [Gammaproteobacteria bacterium]